MFDRKLNLFTLVFLLSTAGCGEKIEPGTSAVAVPGSVAARVETARIIRRPLIYEAVGTVQARAASTVSSKIMGAVREVKVREGDNVRAGDLLVVIDDRQAAAQLQKAEAGLSEARKAEASAMSAREAARAGADLARSTYERYLKLVEEQSASRQEFEEVKAKHFQARAALAQAETTVDAARFRIQQAEAAADGARVSRKDAVITAPYDGTVVGRLIEVGALASPGTPLIALEETGGFRVDLILPETQIGSVKGGQRLNVKVPALPEKSLSGTVVNIVPISDQRSRSFLVKVSIPEIPGAHSGMFARVEIPLSEEAVLLVPASAVVHRGQLTGIFQVDERKTARFRLIRTGRDFGDAVEVISGIREGDRYVADPPPSIANGAPVEAAS